MSVARAFAALLAAPACPDLPEQPVRHAAMLFASTLASAALGSTIGSSQIIRDLTRERGGTPQATLWFSPGPGLPVADAARANAVMSDAAASDDSDLRSILHCGTALVSTALAVAEMQGSTGEEVLAAVVLGYEAAGRVNDAIPRYRDLGFHNSTLQVFCAVVAAGRLLRLDAGQLAHAIALAATSTGGLAKAADTSIAREYNAGQAVLNGVGAALAAGRGFTAEDRILEMPGGFFASFGGADGTTAGHALLDGFGTSWDIVTDMAVKLVPGAHAHHALAEAAGNAVRKGAVRPEEIARIAVFQPGLARLPEPLHPRNLVDMAHSPAYFLAAGAADGTFSWAHAGQDKIDDPVIHRLIDLVEVAPEPADDPGRFRRGARVTVTTRDGRSFSDTVYAPRGTAALGLDWADVDAKYRALMPFRRPRRGCDRKLPRPHPRPARAGVRHAARHAPEEVRAGTRAPRRLSRPARPVC